MRERLYTPPEFDPANWTQIPVQDLGKVALDSEMTITGVGSFVDLDFVQRALLRTLYLASAEATGQSIEAAEQVVKGRETQMGGRLGELLRPAKFGGSIANSAVYLLPFEPGRFSLNTGKRPPHASAAMSLYIKGSLSSRGFRREVSPPFTQEVTYFYGLDPTTLDDPEYVFTRVPGPTESLKEAARWASANRRTSLQIGSLTDVEVVPAIMPNRRNRPPSGESSPI